MTKPLPRRDWPRRLPALAALGLPATRASAAPARPGERVVWPEVPLLVPLTATIGRDGTLRHVIPGEMSEDDMLALARLAAG